MCVSGGCLHVFAHANAAVAGVNPLVPSSACGGPITKAIRAQLKKLIRRNKTRADFAEKFEKPTLKDIARALVAHVRKSVTIDWTLRESAQARIRVLVRRILRKYGYPPDKQEKAAQTVLEQAKLLCADWAV